MTQFHRALLAVSYALCGLGAATYLFWSMGSGMPYYLAGFLCGCLFWALLGAFGYRMGLRAESALRIRRARARDHSKVPTIKEADA